MNILTNDEVLCQQALAQLHHVIDPEIGLNVVDLGLIYELHFDEDPKKITCRMTLTSQFCPMGDVIVDSAHQALQQALPHHQAEIQLTFEPPWSRDMLSAAGREFLNR
ncbi:MAG: metal-sulfur cluster assembly factor [Bacteroidetes bacterium]|nr:metal-sulfur cluster assembly factor [Bacteroidota bacterium]MBS1540206.1 metal-sulfur cluster assembly factor [Bacteroidota bacterium]